MNFYKNQNQKLLEFFQKSKEFLAKIIKKGNKEEELKRRQGIYLIHKIQKSERNLQLKNLIHSKIIHPIHTVCKRIIQNKYVRMILKFLYIPIHIIKRFFTILFYGIRAKLALFTGSLIALTIVVFTYITVNQQTKMLIESYNKEVSISKNFISNLVLSLNTITLNMIRIEEFRNQIQEKSKELKKYQATKVKQVDKTISVFGFKTNLFGALGKEKVIRKEETFYSRYLTPNEIRNLENKVKFEIEQLTGEEISNSNWNELLKIAAEYNQESQSKNQENKKERLLKIRSRLENKLFLLMLEKNQKIIEEIGLDTERFRIQTYPILDFNISGLPEPSFDTKIFNPNSFLALLEVRSEELDNNLLVAIGDLIQNPTKELSDNTLTFKKEDRFLEVFYSPIFKNPHSTTRAKSLELALHQIPNYEDILLKDREYCAKLSTIYPKIRNRLEKLKKYKPPIPPYQDKEFKSLYESYARVYRNREDFLNNFVQNLIQEKDYGTNPKELMVLDSLLYLRPSYMEDRILLKYSMGSVDVERFLKDESYRKQITNRWKELRNWIIEAREETVPPKLASMFNEGSIGKSRSEAEEIMWELDTTPLQTEDGKKFSDIILVNNLIGIIRTFVDKTDGMQTIRNNRDTIIGYAALVCVISIFLAILMSGVFVDKIKKIISKAEEVGQGKLDVEFEHGGNDEFGNLTVALNQMVTGLREREKIKGILGSMIDPVVVTEAMKDLEGLRRGSVREITAFFSDIAGFSTISEKLSSPELADLLNEYLSEMTLILKRYGGVLDKYIGDAIVGIFNSPLDVEDHPLKAVYASLDMKQRLEELKHNWKKNNSYIPEVREMTFRIGLNSGQAKVGLMGTRSISSYTMMGDTVNLAARLESAGKDYGVQILVSDNIAENTKGNVITRKLDKVRVKGKEQPVTLYEVLCREEEATGELEKAIQLYEQGLNAYFAREWSKAIATMENSKQTSKTFFTDKAAQMIIDRCLYYSQNPPPENWDGVYTRTTK